MLIIGYSFPYTFSIDAKGEKMFEDYCSYLWSGRIYWKEEIYVLPLFQYAYILLLIISSLFII